LSAIEAEIRELKARLSERDRLVPRREHYPPSVRPALIERSRQWCHDIYEPPARQR